MGTSLGKVKGVLSVEMSQLPLIIQIDAATGTKHGVFSLSMGQKHGIDLSGKIKGEVGSSSSSLEDLPEDCVSNIISHTSPRDACVAASVSKTFRSTVQSDSVWEKFLPPEYPSLVPGLQVFSSKKELYFALCDDPVLIEEGQKSFWLEKESGKRCIMLSSKQLTITWGNSPQYWQWISIPEARFEEVPELLDVCAFEIRGWMNTRILSPRSHYTAYVVYKTRTGCHGFRDLPIQVGVGLVGQKTRKRFICFDESTDRIKKWGRREIMKSKGREDGWIEAEIGDFFNEGCDEIELSIVDITSPYWKRGLVIQGIEFRPAKKN